MANEFHCFTEDALTRLCMAINALSRERDVLSDNRTTGSATWSSYKIDQRLKELEDALRLDMKSLVAIGYRTQIVETCPEKEDMLDDILYLEKVYNDDRSKVIYYSQYILVNGEKTFIGDTDLALNDTYTKQEMVEKFVGKNEVINTFNGYEQVTSDNIPISQTASKALYDKIMNTTGSPASQHTENRVTLVGAINEIYDKFNDYKIEVENKFTQFEVDIKKKIYPVGAIYISYDGCNPSVMFGGTWEKIENRFLLASGSRAVHTMGGSETVRLTENQLPSHTHVFTANSHTHKLVSNALKYSSTVNPVGSAIPYCNGMLTNGHKDGTYDNMRWYNDAGNYMEIKDCDFMPRQSVNTMDSVTVTGTNANTGGNQAHDNMPPFVVVEVWVKKSN